MFHYKSCRIDQASVAIGINETCERRVRYLSRRALPIIVLGVASPPQDAAVFLLRICDRAPIEMRQKGACPCGLQVTSGDAYPKRREQRKNHSTRNKKHRHHHITNLRYIFRFRGGASLETNQYFSPLTSDLAGRTTHHDHSNTTSTRTVTRYLNP